MNNNSEACEVLLLPSHRVRGSVFFLSQAFHTKGIYLSFESIKQLEVFVLPPRVTPKHLIYMPVDRDTERVTVFCPQTKNTLKWIWPGMAQTWPLVPESGMRDCKIHWLTLVYLSSLPILAKSKTHEKVAISSIQSYLHQSVVKYFLH